MNLLNIKPGPFINHTKEYCLFKVFYTILLSLPKLLIPKPSLKNIDIQSKSYIFNNIYIALTSLLSLLTTTTIFIVSFITPIFYYDSLIIF